MAYTVKLGTFSKLENSTAQPVTTGWAEYNVTLKGGADLFNPTLTLSEDSQNLIGKNYAVMMSRYYFITGITALRNDLCEVELKLDSLATFKTQIGAASLYVLRSASANNGNIRDTYFPIKANSTKYHYVQLPRIVQDHETSIPGDYSSGVIVVNAAGTRTGGASTLWQMLPGDFANLVAALYTDINGFQFSDMIAKVVQAFGGNPQSLINSAMWFPFAFDVYDVRQVTIGSWDASYYDAVQQQQVPITGGLITDPAIGLPDVTFTLPKHPLAAARGGYLNLSPYTQYELGLPGCGVVSLDTGKLQNETGITIRRYMDAFSGQLFVKVIADSTNQMIAYMNGQIGIPISLRGANNANSLIGGALATAGALVGAAITGGASTMIGAVSAGVGTALEAVGGTPVSSSMGAGFAGITDERIWLDTICYDITDADNTHNGRPLCEVRTINTLSGYIKVSEGDVALPAPLPIQQEVKAFLEGGFFYE